METITSPFISYSGAASFVFVSYSHKDKSIVYPIIARMNQDGVRIWYDEGISPSDKWRETIAEHIIKCTIFIVFLSPHAIASENVLDEIYLAHKRYQKKEIDFLSIFLEPLDLPPSLDMTIGRIQALIKSNVGENDYFRKLYQICEKSGVLEKKNPYKSHLNAIYACYTRFDLEKVYLILAGISILGFEIITPKFAIYNEPDKESQFANLISEADIFLLFWSKDAMQSNRVLWELDFILARKGADFIYPICLDDPQEAIPPEKYRILKFKPLETIVKGLLQDRSIKDQLKLLHKHFSR